MPRLRSGYPLIFVLGTGWIANFLHFTAFGFYEDDWYYFAQPYLVPAASWFAQLRQDIIQFDLGRPLQNLSMYVFGYAGAAISSIGALYLLAFAFLALSAALMYRVLRLRFPVLFATVATLFFLLSPLTTIKQFLNYALTVGPGFSFLFLAILLYGQHRSVAAVVSAAAALLTYEPLFLLYLAAPVFRRGKRARRRREILAHLALCVALLLIYFLARKLSAETRVAAISSSPLTTIGLALRSWALFTASSFKSYVYAVYVGIRELSLEPLVYCALCLAPALLVLFRLWPAKSGRCAARRKWWLWNGVVLGAILTALGYGLAYFHLADTSHFPLSGRDTRVSGAASFGSSLMVAGLFALAAEFRPRVARMTTGVLLAILFLYSFVVQRDYIKAWTDQRRFLTQAMLLSPDVQPDSYFIVKTRWILEPLFPGADRRPSIGFSRHGLQVSMQALFGWNSSPRIFFVYSDDWSNYLALRADGKLYWTQASFPGGWERSLTAPVAPGRIITMTEDESGSLRRVNEPLWAGGKQIVQMAAGRTESNWPAFRKSALLREVVPDFVMSAVMSNVADTPAGQPVRMAGGLSARDVQQSGEEASIERGQPLKITTSSHSGYFAAVFPVHVPADLIGISYAFVRARVLTGRVGIGLLDSRSRAFQFRKILSASPQPIDIYLPIREPKHADQLVIYNWAEGGIRSQILIEDAALVRSAPAAP